MKKSLLAFVLIAVFCMAGIALAQHAVKPAISGDRALTLLKEGNERFMTGKRTFTHQDTLRMKEVFEKGQHPYASVLSCSDSRVPPEIIFDTGIGDLFVMRVAGGVCATDQMATQEYAIEHLQIPLFVVVGHTKCGAVTAAADGLELEGNLPALALKIKPAVKRAREKNPSMKGPVFHDECSIENVWVVIEDFIKESPVIRERMKHGELMVVGAVYDLETGKVRFMGPHPRQKELLEKK